MKRRSKRELITSLAVIAAIVIFIGLSAGFFGVRGKYITLDYGACKASYQQYYAKPFLSSSASEIFMAEHNAKVDVLQCLCVNAEAEKDSILNLYNREFGAQATDAYFACSQAIKIYLAQ